MTNYGVVWFMDVKCKGCDLFKKKKCMMDRCDLAVCIEAERLRLKEVEEISENKIKADFAAVIVDAIQSMKKQKLKTKKAKNEFVKTENIR